MPRRSDLQPRRGSLGERVAKRRRTSGSRMELFDDDVKHEGRPKVETDESHAVVYGVPDEEARQIRKHSECFRLIERRGRRGASVAREARSPGARHRRDRAGRRDADHAVVIRVRDEEAAVRQGSNSVRGVEPCRRGDCRDRAIRGDAANPRVARIGDQEAPTRERRDREREVQLRRCCRPTVAREPGRSATRDRRDDAGR